MPAFSCGWPPAAEQPALTHLRDVSFERLHSLGRNRLQGRVRGPHRLERRCRRGFAPRNNKQKCCNAMSVRFEDDTLFVDVALRYAAKPGLRVQDPRLFSIDAAF